MRMLRTEVAAGVLFEVVARDDDRRFGLALPPFFLLGLVVRIGIVNCQRQTLAVRRPGEVADAALDAGQLERLAARPVEQPYLRAVLLVLVLLVVIAARREEGKVAAIGAPLGRRFVLRAGRELHLLCAIPADHPEIRIALVLLDIGGRHHIGHPLAVGRELRVANEALLGLIVENDGALGLRVGRKRPAHQHGHAGGDGPNQLHDHILSSEEWGTLIDDWRPTARPSGSHS